MKRLGILAVLLIILLVIMLLSLLFGGSGIGIGEVFPALLTPGSHDTFSTIVWRIRFPRIILGAVVGMGLAASGCVFQGMLKNPLADPYTLGISGGAAFGVSLGAISGLAALSVFLVPLCAFAGTMLCVFLVYLAASRRDFSLSSLILSGVILGFIFSSLVLLMFALTDAQKLHATLLWLMGDLSNTSTPLIAIVALIVPAGVALLALFGRELNILTLGDEKAQHLGIPAVPVKKALFVVASLVAGACVSASGIIGFVGLIIPHAVRRMFGADNQLVLPASALAGAAFLTLCDTASRTVIAPLELPVGVITGIIGGIFFLTLLLHARVR